MRMLITGAAGMLGVDVARAAAAAGHEPIALPRAELDVTDAAATDAAVARARPDAVVNCAAFTRVDDAEGEPEAADRVNAGAAGNLAAAAARHGAWLVHISTDYVFDGEKTSGPYLESDRTGPRSVYGATKLAGEAAVACAAPDVHTIVRSSWLFGTAGPCFPQTILRLAADRDTLRVVSDQIGCPTSTADLAAAIVELAEARSHPGILHVAGGGETSWHGFAREIVAAAGLACEVQPCTTAEFPRPAPRPAYSVLRSERSAPVLRDWHDGLHQYLGARA